MLDEKKRHKVWIGSIQTCVVGNYQSAASSTVAGVLGATKNRTGYFACSRLKEISVHPLPASVEKVVGRFLSGLARQKVILFSSTR